MKPTKEALLRFLKEVDGDFNPPLSGKTDLTQYADKILHNAVLFCDLTDSGAIRGIIVLYANDYEKRYAYIPLAGVGSSYRKQGIASKLLSEAIQYVETLKGKIQVLGIHSNNPVAISLYQKMGFESVETIEGRTYLELKL